MLRLGIKNHNKLDLLDHGYQLPLEIIGQFFLMNGCDNADLNFIIIDKEEEIV